jgi:catechol 2,3-dioxygenase-like lactoylglutathione lyase family enzyme
VSDPVTIDSISAVTLGTHDMNRAVDFYRAAGFELVYGGRDAAFTVFRAGQNYLNLSAWDPAITWGLWGRIVVYVSDVDGQFRRVIEAGYTPEFEPRDAPWHERYFHVRDPDGHEISFAKRLR